MQIIESRASMATVKIIKKNKIKMKKKGVIFFVHMCNSNINGGVCTYSLADMADAVAWKAGNRRELPPSQLSETA